MFNSNRKSTLLALTAFVLNATVVSAQEAELASVNAASLPINVANAEQQKQVESVPTKDADTLISPSKAQVVSSDTANLNEATAKENKVSSEVTAPNTGEQKKNIEETSSQVEATPQVIDNTSEQNSDSPAGDSFDFDLKMKSVSPTSAENVPSPQEAENKSPQEVAEQDITTSVQYKVNPVEELGNSVLSKLDDDLFSQMSAIEKSTTLLTLELRREKIRNEIEAQKAIRRKNAEDAERLEAENKLKELERKKQIEAQVIREQQILADKEKLIEVLKQRKLINAYMNQMLVLQQDWLKEKESLYAQLSEADAEKKAVIASFKQKLDKVLEASAKNIQVAEAAKANFERIIKGLKTRNEQLKKRIEADALIIKNAKSSLYLKSQSIEELKDKNAALLNSGKDTSTSAKLEDAIATEAEDEEPFLLSSEYAILGITGQAENMFLDLIDSQGQSATFKVGSVLPTGHVVSEIGPDFARFSKDGRDDFLYIGRSIDGITPTLGLVKGNASN